MTKVENKITAYNTIHAVVFFIFFCSLFILQPFLFPFKIFFSSEFAGFKSSSSSFGWSINIRINYIYFLYFPWMWSNNWSTSKRAITINCYITRSDSLFNIDRNHTSRLILLIYLLSVPYRLLLLNLHLWWWLDKLRKRLLIHRRLLHHRWHNLKLYIIWTYNGWSNRWLLDIIGLWLLCIRIHYKY